MRVATFVLTLTILASSTMSAQDKTHREWYEEGLEAARQGDMAASVEALQKALELNPHAVNRPFMQYHLARALAVSGDREAAYRILNDVWKEGIEGFVIFQAENDPVFRDIAADPEWEELRLLATALELAATELAPSVWQLDGAGATILAHRDSSGWLLVDTGYREAGAALLRALRETGASEDVAIVINTHGHEDHMGGNLQFPGAMIFAHPKTSEMMRSPEPLIPGVPIAPKPAAAIPDVLVDGHIAIRHGEETIHLHPLPTHSGSDLMVVFENAAVVHLGDCYFPGVSSRIFPGSDPEYFFTTLEAGLKGVPDEGFVVTGHSETVPVSMLRAAISETREIIDFIEERVVAGDGLEKMIRDGAERGYPPEWIRHYARRDE